MQTFVEGVEFWRPHCTLVDPMFGPSAVVSREGFDSLTHQMLTASRDHMLLARGAI